jgi:quercetin dioxygenase-like cupin family protein
MSTLNKIAARIIGTAFAACLGTSLMAQTEPPGFIQILPDQVKWQSSATVPAGAQSAVLYGDPGKAALFVTRVRQPADYKIPPHTHPEERVYTVISGTFYIGFGDRFDATKLRAFPAGSTFVVPANTAHFHWMRSGEAVVQVSGIGPSGIEYVDHADDPRTKR